LTQRDARRGRRAIAWLLLFSLGTTGCYRNLELATPVPDAGTRIVARLTPSGVEQMAPLVGADPVAVEGMVTRWDAEEAELSLLRVEHEGARDASWTGERVVFPVSALRDVRERRLDRARTTGFIAAVTATAVALAIVFFRFVAPGDEGGPGGTDPVE
jgi:hypothetical protein